MSKATDNGGERGRKRKSRWSDETHAKVCIPGVPTVLPNTLTPEQEESFILQLQINELTHQLRVNEVTIPHNREERSPSPPPIYDSTGKRLNTRAYRERKKIETRRHQLIQQMLAINPSFKPPSDYKPPKYCNSEKVLLPQDQYPHINFIGLLIGPRGSTIKAIEKQTGTKIIIRGKGSTLPSKVAPVAESNEPLHAFITADNSEAVANAAKFIQDVITKGVEDPNHLNQLRKEQLYALAVLNGTIRPQSDFGSHSERPLMRNNVSSIVCSACGGGGHITSDCISKRPCYQEKPESSDNSNKFDKLYQSFLEEIGANAPESDSLQPQYRT
ncbi:splicing factor 1-like [Anopheles funestus]|uniref:splicing factor 1-like n=1 Tax=Anopheles funestus TaxID=62324 RepID=UPI0020C719D5|nr:splicing factor 1-like [Anopheles funestus]